MKKWLVYLIVFFSLFFIIDNVKASFKDMGNFEINSSDLKYITTFDNYNTTNYPNYTTGMEQLIQAMNIDYETEDYIIFRDAFASNYIIHGYKWNKNANFSLKPGLYASAYMGEVNGTSYLRFLMRPIDEIKYYRWHNGENIKTFTYKNVENVISQSINDYSYNKTEKKYKLISQYSFYYYSSIDLKFYRNDCYDENTYNGNGYSSLTINDVNNDLCYQYYPNDTIIEKTGTPVWEKPQKPEIDFEQVSRFDDNETIKIKFTIFDNNKFIYFYKIGNGNKENDNWIEITKNDFKYTSFINTTLEVGIMEYDKYIEEYIKFMESEDKENSKINYEFIEYDTYEFIDLKESIPEIDISLKTPQSCFLDINSSTETVCKLLKVNILNYGSIDKYLWEYSMDGNYYTSIWTDKMEKIISENTIIYFRLLNRENNEYIKTIEYEIRDITSNLSQLGPYIELVGTYNTSKMYYGIGAYFYNYNSSLYNYFYTTDGQNWIQIYENELSIYSQSDEHKILFKNFNIYNNCKFIVKIEDKEGNLIFSNSYDIKLEEENTPNSILNNFKNIAKINENISKYFKEIYSMMRNSKLGGYIFIIIIGSIIILLVKSMKN